MLSRREVQKSLKTKIDWILENPTSHQNIHVLESLFIHFFSEWLKASFGTTEEKLQREYELFIDRNFGAQSWPTLAGYISHTHKGQTDSEISKILAKHFKKFREDVYLKELKLLNNCYPERRSTKVYVTKDQKKSSRRLKINIKKK